MFIINIKNFFYKKLNKYEYTIKSVITIKYLPILYTKHTQNKRKIYIINRIFIYEFKKS